MSEKENDITQNEKIKQFEERLANDSEYRKKLLKFFGDIQVPDIKSIKSLYPEWFNDLDIVSYLNSCTYESRKWKIEYSKLSDKFWDKEECLKNADGKIIVSEKNGNFDNLSKTEVYIATGLVIKFNYVHELAPYILANKEFVLKHLIWIVKAHKFDVKFLNDVDFLQKVENWNLPLDGAPLYNQVPFEVKKNPIILNHWIEKFNILYNPHGIPFELQLGKVREKIQGVYKYDNSVPITTEELKKNPSHIMTLNREMRSDYNLMLDLASTGIDVYAFCNPELKRNPHFLRDVLNANKQLLQIDNYQPGSNYGCIKNLFADADVNFEVEDELFFELIEVLINHEKAKQPDALIDCWINNSKTLLRNHTFREKIMDKYGDELFHDREEVTETEEKIAIILKEMLVSYENDRMKKTLLENSEKNLVKKTMMKF